MTRKNTTQTIPTATRNMVVFVLIWIAVISVLTIYNLCVIINNGSGNTKNNKIDDNKNLPPLTIIEYLEVDK